MNANEMADKCGLMIEDYDFGLEVSAMLRQQQAEIEALKAKILTDEEIINSAEEAGFNWSEDKGIFVRHSNGSWIGLDSKMVEFARAILRKAQKK